MSYVSIFGYKSLVGCIFKVWLPRQILGGVKYLKPFVKFLMADIKYSTRNVNFSNCWCWISIFLESTFSCKILMVDIKNWRIKYWCLTSKFDVSRQALTVCMRAPIECFSGILLNHFNGGTRLYLILSRYWAILKIIRAIMVIFHEPINHMMTMGRANFCAPPATLYAPKLL